MKKLKCYLIVFLVNFIASLSAQTITVYIDEGSTSVISFPYSQVVNSLGVSAWVTNVWFEFQNPQDTKYLSLYHPDSKDFDATITGLKSTSSPIILECTYAYSYIGSYSQRIEVGHATCYFKIIVNYVSTVSGNCGESGSNVKWYLNKSTGVMTLQGSGAMKTFFYDGSLPPWNNYLSYIKTIIIGEGITTISYCAFQGCQNLTSVTIPKTVYGISNMAFTDCKNLKAINLSSSIEIIGNFAFEGCTSLEKLEIPESVTSLGSYLCSECSNLKSVIIKASIEEIGDNSFENCSKLTTVVLPSSIKKIGYSAYSKCSALNKIYINAYTAPTIMVNAFYNVASNGKLYVPQGADYSTWMESSKNWYLGYYGWSIPSSLAPDSITISPESATLNQGDKIKLDLQYVPQNSFSECVWKSSDTSVATVDKDGVVNAISNGIAIITATTTNNLKNVSTIFVRQILLGDANDDGSVNVNDISTIAAYILEDSPQPFVFANADANGDGVINVNDISATATIILDGDDGNDDGDDDEDKKYLKCPDDNHPHAIDLGLPSGTKWCCCNVGATTPEGYGGYYAWGETSEKSVYSQGTYAYFSGGTGYKNIGSDIAGTKYDVAHVRMGASWRMASHEQQMELVNNCTRTWTNQNGVNGILVIGKNDGQIFLPAAGSRWDGDLCYAGSNGYYWSSSFDSVLDFMAFNLEFDSDNLLEFCSTFRSSGRSVRAVCP